MKIKIAKQSSEDSGYIELSELFARLKSELPESVTMAEVEEIIQDSIAPVHTSLSSMAGKDEVLTAVLEFESALSKVVSREAVDKMLASKIYPILEVLRQVATKEGVKEAIFEAIEEVKPEISTKLQSGVFNVSAPINIASTNKIEGSKHPVGTMYFDVVNDRIRVLTNKGWRTK